ncbi:MAG: HAD-IA family hydrolase [Pseudomonadota bacterium]|nr:HAD-IA family hydrolase [Pseudomonadota bacterium]
MDLRDRTHWIFDMDGTLTVPMHDFAWLHRALEVPEGEDILATIDRRPAERAAADREVIRAWEDEIAGRARAQDDALALLDALVRRGRILGVLTRNTLEGARLTLESAGLARYFDPAAIVSRDCAPPKPHPGGGQRLLRHWGVEAGAAVVVGDWVYDAQAGRAAGTATVLVMRHGPQPWADEADLLVDDLWGLAGRV